MSSRDRSFRLAEILPPTLLPNPVLMAAPHPDRMMSLLAACTVYCAMGAAVLGGARHIATSHSGDRTRTIIIDLPIDPMPVVPVVRPPQPATATVRPPGATTVAPQANANTVPDETPDTLPTKDQHMAFAAPAEDTLGPHIDGIPVNPEPATVAPARVGPPVEVDFRQIQILHQVAPVYPALARLAKRQGPVELRMTIDTQGVPTTIDVLSGPCPMLIDEALRVARLWRFQPASVNGEAVSVTFRLTVAFRLAN